MCIIFLCNIYLLTFTFLGKAGDFCVSFWEKLAKNSTSWGIIELNELPFTSSFIKIFVRHTLKSLRKKIPKESKGIDNQLQMVKKAL